MDVLQRLGKEKLNPPPPARMDTAQDGPATPARAGIAVIKAVSNFKRAQVRSMKTPERAKLNITSKTSQGLDAARSSASAYEYLCHLEEAKRWLEQCLQKELPSVHMFEEELASGVVLCQFAAFFAPKKVKARNVFDPDMVIFKTQGRKFRHADNISRFLEAMTFMKFPTFYHPTVPDVYDRKNTPRLIFCLHALSFYLHKLGIAPELKSLAGKVEFSEEDVAKMEKKIDTAGIALPSFTFQATQATILTLDSADLAAAEADVPQAAPPPPYRIHWPFLPEESETWEKEGVPEVVPDKKIDWLASNRRSRDELLASMEAHVEDARQALQDLYTSEYELHAFLSDHFPHLLPQIQGDGEEDEEEQRLEEEFEAFLSATNVDLAPDDGADMARPPAEERADAAREEFVALSKQTTTQSFWDHMFWGSARPFFVSWPFLVDDAPDPEHEHRRLEVTKFLEERISAINECLAERRLAFIALREAERREQLAWRPSLPDVKAPTLLRRELTSHFFSVKSFDELVSRYIPHFEAAIASSDDPSAAAGNAQDALEPESLASDSSDDPAASPAPAAASHNLGHFAVAESCSPALSWDDMWWGIDPKATQSSDVGVADAMSPYHVPTKQEMRQRSSELLVRSRLKSRGSLLLDPSVLASPPDTSSKRESRDKLVVAGSRLALTVSSRGSVSASASMQASTTASSSSSRKDSVTEEPRAASAPPPQCPGLEGSSQDDESIAPSLMSAGSPPGETTPVGHCDEACAELPENRLSPQLDGCDEAAISVVITPPSNADTNDVEESVGEEASHSDGAKSAGVKEPTLSERIASLKNILVSSSSSSSERLSNQPAREDQEVVEEDEEEACGEMEVGEEGEDEGRIASPEDGEEEDEEEEEEQQESEELIVGEQELGEEEEEQEQEEEIEVEKGEMEDGEMAIRGGEGEEMEIEVEEEEEEEEEAAAADEQTLEEEAEIAADGGSEAEDAEREEADAEREVAEDVEGALEASEEALEASLGDPVDEDMEAAEAEEAVSGDEVVDGCSSQGCSGEEEEEEEGEDLVTDLAGSPQPPVDEDCALEPRHLRRLSSNPFLDETIASVVLAERSDRHKGFRRRSTNPFLTAEELEELENSIEELDPSSIDDIITS